VVLEVGEGELKATFEVFVAGLKIEGELKGIDEI
jgi:hypothetical protein